MSLMFGPGPPCVPPQGKYGINQAGEDDIVVPPVGSHPLPGGGVVDIANVRAFPDTGYQVPGIRGEGEGAFNNSALITELSLTAEKYPKGLTDPAAVDLISKFIDGDFLKFLILA